MHVFNSSTWDAEADDLWVLSVSKNKNKKSGWAGQQAAFLHDFCLCPCLAIRGCQEIPEESSRGAIILQARAFCLVGGLTSLPEQRVGTFLPLSPSRWQKSPAGREESNETQGLKTYYSDQPGSTNGCSWLSSQPLVCGVQGGQGCHQLHSDFEASPGWMKLCFFFFLFFF